LSVQIEGGSKTPPPDERLPFSARLLVMSFVLLAIVIGASLWGARQAGRYAEAAFETQARELETVHMLSLLQDTEIGQRGYLITGDEAFLQPYTDALAEITALKSSFKVTGLADDVSRDRAEQLDILISERLDRLARGLEAARQGDHIRAVEAVKSGGGKARMDEIRTIVTEIDNARAKTLAEQQASLDRALVWVRAAEILGVLLLIVTALTIVRQSVATLEAQRKIRESQASAVAAAESANHAKSNFLATMSHELRTPMTAILGMCDLLMAGKQGAEERHITQLLARNAQTLLRLLNDILDLSKIEAGRLTFETSDFRLSQILDEARSLFGPVASQKGLLLVVDKSAGPKDVFLGDSKRLQQVLVNLVSNAIKFTEKGSVCVRNRQSVAPDGRTRVEIEVEDTGEGISDEAKSRLFREFEQEDASTSRRFGGTGLGLSISKRILDALDGEIEVHSAKGQGARFVFSLPLADGDPASVIDKPQISVVDAGRPLAGPRLKILLAEDTPATQFLMTRMLSLWGHEIVTVDNGEAAVAAANEGGWDIILMDMQMPLMDGPQATRLIREGGGPSAHIPIIALTADAVKENRAAYLAAGCNVVATKPVNWALLAHQMATALGLPRGTETPPITSPLPQAARSDDWRDLPLLDHALLDEMIAALGVDTFRPLLEATAENLRQYLPQLEADIGASNLANAKRCAHRIRGAAGQIGAARIAGLARVIEVESQATADAAEAAAWLRAAIAETGDAFDALFIAKGKVA